MIFDSVLTDLRIGARLLTRRPGFTLMAVASLGLGIGLVTTQFSLIDGVLLRGLPFNGAERILHISWQDPQHPDPGYWQTIPFRDYLALRERQTTFESLAGMEAAAVNVSGQGRLPSHQTGTYTTASLPAVLGVHPMLGRWFTAEEDRPRQPLRIVLSHDFWQADFGSDPAVLGRPLSVNGEPGTIIGVMPPRFGFPGQNDLWTNLRPSAESDPKVRFLDRVEIVGRLKPGVPVERAQAELNTIAADLAKRWPDTNHGYDHLNVQQVSMAYSGGGIRTILYLMLSMTVFILILACVNVANMLLGRASQRTREFAVRSAVGAGKGRLIRQLLAESLLIAVIGAGAGLLVAGQGVSILQYQLVEQRLVPGWFEFRVDANVVTIAAMAMVASALLAGIVPALQASRVDVNTALKDNSRAAAGMGIGRIARWLVTAQIGFSTMLLIAATVMAGTIYRARQANLRYDPETLLTGRIELQEATQPTPEARARFYRTLLQQVQSVPGVESVAATSQNMVYSSVPTQVAPEGATYAHPNDRPSTWLQVVTTDYFKLIGVKATAGRLFDLRETSATDLSAVVNESFARRHFSNGNAVGRRFRSGQTGDKWVTVVGVVPDLHMQGVLAPADQNEEGFYLVEDQMGWGWLYLFVRTKSDPLQFVPAIRKAIARLDPNQPIYSIGTLASETVQSLRGFTIIGTMVVIFAGITLFLGALGVYGVTSQSVSRRTREFGIRMALGSTVQQVLGLVLAQGGRQISIGVAIGLVTGFLLTVPMRNIFGTALANSVSVYVAVIALIVIVGMVALWIPARRAARTNPTEALRAE